MYRHCRMPPPTTANVAGIGDCLKRVAVPIAPRRARGVRNGRRAVRPRAGHRPTPSSASVVGPFLLQLFKQAFHGRQARLKLSVLGLHSIDVGVEGFHLSRGNVAARERPPLENAYPVVARLMRD